MTEAAKYGFFQQTLNQLCKVPNASLKGNKPRKKNILNFFFKPPGDSLDDYSVGLQQATSQTKLKQVEFHSVPLSAFQIFPTEKAQTFPGHANQWIKCTLYNRNCQQNRESGKSPGGPFSSFLAMTFSQCQKRTNSPVPLLNRPKPPAASSVAICHE